MEHCNGSTSDFILSLGGSQTASDSSGAGTGDITPFPEDYLANRINRIKNYQKTLLELRVIGARDKLDEAMAELGIISDWTPDIADFLDSEPYDFLSPNGQRFEDPMYTEVHIL